MTTTGTPRPVAAGVAEVSGHTTPPAGTPLVYDLRTAASSTTVSPDIATWPP